MQKSKFFLAATTAFVFIYQSTAQSESKVITGAPVESVYENAPFSTSRNDKLIFSPDGQTAYIESSEWYGELRDVLQAFSISDLKTPFTSKVIDTPASSYSRIYSFLTDPDQTLVVKNISYNQEELCKIDKNSLKTTECTGQVFGDLFHTETGKVVLFDYDQHELYLFDRIGRHPTKKITWYHDSRRHLIALSPDGSLLAVYYLNPNENKLEIQMYNMSNFELIKKYYLSGSFRPAPEGSFINKENKNFCLYNNFSKGSSLGINLMCLDLQSTEQTTIPLDGTVTSYHSKDYHFIDNGKETKIFDVNNLKIIGAIPYSLPVSTEYLVAFHPNRNFLSIYDRKVSQISIYNLNDLSTTVSFSISNSIRGIAWQPNENNLFAISSNSIIKWSW